MEFIFYLFLYFILTQVHFFFIASKEREREKGREREKHWCNREALIGCLPRMPGPEITLNSDQGWTHNPGMCPDLEWNLQPFDYETKLQPTEPHWPGQSMPF